MIKQLFCVFPLLAGSLTAAPDFSIDEAGLRVGLDAENGESFTSVEAIVYFDSPWEWEVGERLEIELETEASLGILDGNGTTAGLVHFGFAAFFELDDFPLRFVLSTGPTLLSEDEFDDFDIGGHFQFTSAAGLDWEVMDEWSLGYRYQHISNAGLEGTNPGLNLHVLALSYDF